MRSFYSMSSACTLGYIVLTIIIFYISVNNFKSKLILYSYCSWIHFTNLFLLSCVKHMKQLCFLNILYFKYNDTAGRNPNFNKLIKLKKIIMRNLF